MTKKIVRTIVLFIIFLQHFSPAQNNQWIFGLPGGVSADVAYDVEVDSLGNSYVGGNFQGTIDFNPGSGINNLTATGGGWDIFLAKYDANGNYLWAITIPGVGGNDVINHVSLDNKGDCYVTGWFAGGNVDFNPGAGSAPLSSAGGNDIFVAKYDVNGNYQWAFRIGGASSDEGNGIATDDAGNCYVTGNFSGTNIDFDPTTGTAPVTGLGANDAFVAKYSATGSYVWAFAIGGSGSDLGWGVGLDATANVYVTGTFSGSNIDFDPSGSSATKSSNGSGDIFIAKYTSGGIYNWAINAGGTSNDIGFSIAVDASGNSFVSGTFQGTADFDPSAVTANVTSSGGNDIFVSKYNSTGAYQWAFKIGGNASDDSWYKSTDISLDCSDNVYVAGGFASTNVDFDPGSGSKILSSAGSKDIFVAQYTTNGNYLCAFKVGLSAEDDAYGIAVSQNGCHVVGRFQGTAMNFNPAGTAKNLSSASWSDVFIGKYDMCQPPNLNFATITGNHDVCPGNTLTLTAGGGGTYVWQNSSTASSIIVVPNANTTYSVIVTTKKFCRDTAYAPVNVFVPPTITTSPNTYICSGGTVTITAGGAWIYVWSPITINPQVGPANSVSPTATTTYSVTGTDLNGCSATAAITVTVNQSPSLLITPSPSMCKGFSYVLSVAGANNYLWSPSTGLNTNTGGVVTASPTITTTYSVIGTDINGCTNTISTVLNINSNPIVLANLPTTICTGQSSLLSASGASVYNWNPIGVLANALTVFPTVTTTYTVTGIDNNGCTNIATTTVNVNPLPVIIVNTPAPICVGASATLNAAGANTYNWLPMNLFGASISVSPTTTTTYKIIGIDNNGCIDSTTTTLAVNALPVLSVSSGTMICNGSNTTLTVSGASQYLWQPAASLNSPNGSSVVASPSVATTYTVTGTDANGCSNSVSVTVTLSASLSAAVISNDTSVCIGNKANLYISGLGGSGTFFYNWQPGNNSSQALTVAPTVTTTYTVTISDNCGSTPLDTVVTVTINALPIVQFTSDAVNGCGPLCLTFDHSSSSLASATSGIWNFGDGNSSGVTGINHSAYVPQNHCYLNPGSYDVSLSLTDVNGCSDSLILSNYITVFPNPVAGFFYSPTEITILNPTVSFVNQSISSTNWIWSFDDPTDASSSEQHPNFTYPDTGSYRVQQIVVNEFGCRDTAENFILIKPDFALYVANTFTPNGDAVNDVFLPMGIGIDASEYDFYIYDRWGNLIFHSTNPKQGWNGKSNNGTQLSQEDTYVWKVILKDVLEKRHRYLGHVNLIR